MSDPYVTARAVLNIQAKALRDDIEQCQEAITELVERQNAMAVVAAERVTQLASVELGLTLLPPAPEGTVAVQVQPGPLTTTWASPAVPVDPA